MIKLKNEWRKAELRFLKIEEIREALDKGKISRKYSAVAKNGKRLKGEEARLAMIDLGKKLTIENQDRSEDIIKIANELTGIPGKDLKKDAMDITKYKSGPKNRDAFEKEITDMIEDIYDQERKKLGIRFRTSLNPVEKKTTKNSRATRKEKNFELVPKDEISEAL